MCVCVCFKTKFPSLLIRFVTIDVNTQLVKSLFYVFDSELLGGLEQLLVRRAICMPNVFFFFLSFLILFFFFFFASIRHSV